MSVPILLFYTYFIFQANERREQLDKGRVTEPARLIDRLFLLLPASLLIVLKIFVFGPATIYRGNLAEFGIGFGAIEALYIYPGIVSLAALAGIGMVLPKRVLHIYASLLFGTGIILWIQGDILVWDYGVFDGSGIKWDEYRWRGWADAGVWVGLLLVVIFFRKKVARISALASLTVIAMQGIFFIASYPSLPPASASKTEKVEEAPGGLFNYSSSFNIIHIIMDGLQTDVFEEIVKEDSLASGLEGFVLFRENMAASNPTNFSLPSIFSGEVYEGEVELNSYVNEAYSEKAFYRSLFESGYDVNLVPSIRIPAKNFSNYYAIPMGYGGTRKTIEISEAASLMDVVLFRHSPQYLKKKVYNSENWLVRRAFASGAKLGQYRYIEFFRDYTKKISASGLRPAYHFVHLSPPHPPNVAYANCEYAGKILPAGRDSYKGEARCALSLFIQFLDRLRNLGIYDSSFIILHADHGWGFTPVNIKNKPKKGISHNTIGRSLALLAVKPPNSKGAMTVSNAKTTLTDIPSTVLEMAGLPNHYRGPSVFELDPDGKRERWFFIPRDLSGKVLINRYRVAQSVYDYESWNKEEDISRSYPVSIYRWGTPIQFGVKGNALLYQNEGWSRPLGEYNWTNDKRATLSIPITVPQSATITLKAIFKAFVYPGIIDRQTVHVVVNGKEVVSWVITEAGFRNYSVSIPKSLLSGSDRVTITFNLPDAVPANIVPQTNYITEPRGIALQKLVLIDGHK